MCGAFGAFSPAPDEAVETLIFTGDIRGYLSPCGCAKPQIGGIKRMATAIRNLQKNEKTYYVDIGNWTKPGTRQEQLKAEALAEFFSKLKPTFLNVGTNDAQLGAPYLVSLRDATNGALRSSIFCGEEFSTSSGVRAGSLFIKGLMPEEDASRLGEGTGSMDSAMSGLPRGSAELVVMFAGPKEQAIKLANRYSGISLIIYSMQGDPPKQPLFVNGACLVSVADKGRYVGKIELIDGKWTNFSLIQLGPEISDDGSASLAYTSYLRRVTDEDLLSLMPREDRDVAYVGSDKCASCHVEATHIWKESKHAQALATLEQTKNDRDPECVGCHVVGLDYKSGFVNRKVTENLANVGCESCHGPGQSHIQNPQVRMGKVGERSCQSCHVNDHSPEFKFEPYWDKIRH